MTKKLNKYRAPSLKTLRNNFPQIDDENLKNIRRVIRGEVHASTASSVYRALKAQGAFANSLTAIDQLLEHHGVEVIRNAHDEVIAEYSNSGDTYAATIILNHNGNYQVTTLGDYVEAYERRHAKLP